MPEASQRIWRLSDQRSDLGLCCAKDGLFLGGTPLLDRQSNGFAARPQADLETVFSRGFGFSVSLDRVMSGLTTVASALNAGDLCRARIAAVHLRIPDLPDALARLDMQIEDLALKLDRIAKTTAAGDWNPPGGGGWDPEKHPRAGAGPNPGWFAPTGGNETSDESPHATLVSDKPGDDGRLHLPPGKRNDEIGDLLEWIANAKPEDADAINAEIKRVFYDAGDFNDGAMFHAALAEVLRHPDQATRERVLETYEPITHQDPGEIGQISSWLEGAVLGRLPALRSLWPGAGSTDVAEAESSATSAEAAAAARAEFWKLPWSTRGFAIHAALKGSLPWWFEGIDDFSADGVATSFKSIDLNAGTYQNAKNLGYRINRYVNDLAKFNGKSYENWSVSGEDITKRVLKLVVPEGSISEAQEAAIDAAVSRARAREIFVVVMPF